MAYATIVQADIVDAANNDDLSITVSVFENPAARTLVPTVYRWGDLTAMLESPKTYSSKKACPLLKLASFGTARTASGCLRSDQNLIQCYGVEGDYDSGEMSVDEAAALLAAAGIEAFIYTSASHTPAAPRFRLLAPLSRPCDPHDRRHYTGIVNAALLGRLSPESFTLSQSYYFGKIANGEYETRRVRGTPIDQLQVALKPNYPTRGDVIDVPTDDADLRDFARMNMFGEVTTDTFKHLQSALESIPADDRNVWIYLGQALGSFKHTEQEAVAYKLWHDWSEKSEKFDERVMQRTWSSFKGDRVGYAAVFKTAQEHGWKNPLASGKLMGAQALSDAIARCRALPAEELMNGWADIALSLSPAQVPSLLDEISHLTRTPLSALKATLKLAKTEAAKALRKASIDSRAAGRQVIHYRPEDRTEHAHEVEKAILAKATPGTYLQFGGQLARVTVRPFVGTRRVGAEAPPDIPHIELLDDVGALQEVERVAMFVKQMGDGCNPIAVPSDVIDVLLKKASHAAPVVSGLVSHPIVIPSNGDIVAAEGLHEGTGLYLLGAAIDAVHPFTQAEAKAALVRLKDVFLEGFEFASTLDEDIAIAGLLTGIERKVCDTAPGFAALASVQASGKTTLIRRTHLVLTGHDMPITSFPDRDEAELQKRLLTMLIRAPALVCFDNLNDGTTFRSAPLAAAMTSPVLTQRLLGASKDTSCPTNVLFCITGNNLSLGKDELTRWLVCRLQPAAINPEARSFKHSDVVAHAQKIRHAVLRDALGIIAGYKRYGRGIAPASRFPVWDSVVRQPLIWAGGEDIARCFSANAEASEERQAHAALVGCLHARFGTREFSAADVAELGDYNRYSSFADNNPQFKAPDDKTPDPEQEGFLHLTRQEISDATRSALHSLQSKDPSNESSVGRVLRSLVSTRTALALPTGSVGAHIADRMLRGRRVYRIST